jgi:TonB-dependent starch-binding outer membrane protein SusC
MAAPPNRQRGGQHMHDFRLWLGPPRPTLRVVAFATALLPVVAVFARAQGNGQGAITGTITDAATHTPISDVQIRILGSTQGTLSRDNGTYRIGGVRVGTVSLVAQRVGYKESAALIVTVTDGGTATADFALAAAATTLSEVVVEATGETERSRESGNLVNNIAADSVPPAAIANFSDALSGRAPGVQVQQATGTTGGGSQIRIRGANSISLANAPLLIIDGVRADNTESSVLAALGGAGGDAANNTGGQGPSRFDDIDPNDIETIEVVKGPAGAALYGAAGANGVIYVTTKHGVAGHTRWTSHAEYGSVRDYTTFQPNYDIMGNFNPGGPPSIGTGCTLDDQHTGLCTATSGVNTFNPLQAITPFVNGYRDSYGGSVSGGTDAAQYFLSGDYYREQGVYANNVNRRGTAHATVTAHPTSTIDVSLNATYLQGRLSLPQNDNSFFGVLGLGLLGSAYNDSQHGYFEGITPNIIAQYQTLQNTERYTTGATGTWRVLPWLTGTVQGGVDFLNRLDNSILPANVLVNNGPLTALGFITADPAQVWTYSTSATATASYPLSRKIAAKSTVGAQYTDQATKAFPASGVGLVGTTTSLAGLSSQFTTTEANTDQPTVAVYGQQEFSLNDRIFLTGTLRHEATGILDEPTPTTTYPSGSLSWVIGEEPWFPKTSVLSSLRLRTAVGVAGQIPDFRQAAVFFDARPVRIDGQDGGGAVLAGTGAPLVPERSVEAEGGFDAGLFSDRINVTATYYNKTTHSALVQATLAPSISGLPGGLSPTRFVNIGETTNKGFEAGVSGTIVKSRPFTLDLAATGSINNNKLVTLGSAVPLGFIPFDAGLAGEIQRFQPGLPMGGYFAQHYTYSDANHDGIITSDEINASSTQSYVGAVMPPTEVTITPTATFFRLFHVTAQFDHRDGNNIFDETEEFRCSFLLCQGLYDKHAPLAQQAGSLAAIDGLSDAYFIQDAEFWKFRELTFALDAPSVVLQRLRIAALRVSVSGRNLHVWTPYKGIDPEINTSDTDFTDSEFFSQPPVRYWTGRVDITF